MKIKLILSREIEFEVDEDLKLAIILKLLHQEVDPPASNVEIQDAVQALLEDGSGDNFENVIPNGLEVSEVDFRVEVEEQEILDFPVPDDDWEARGE